MDLPQGHPLKVGSPLPQSIGRCADLYHDVRDMRLAMEKEVAEIQARETEIQEHIINNLSTGDDTGAAGLKYRAQLVVKRKPRLLTGEGGDGWGLLTSWIRKHDAFYMLQKRLNEKSVDDWVAENPERGNLPGTEMVNIKTLSVTKI